ncbi:MAG: YbbR-like domain-containing protein [Myxococcota bacterium]
MKWSSFASRAARAGRLLQRAFTQNLGLKLVSLAVAIALFSVVRGAEDSTRSVFVDVVALLPPPDSKIMLVSEVPDKVRLTVRGSRSLVNSIDADDLPPVQVDLRKPSSTYFYLDPDDFEIPAGVEVVQLSPSSIPLTWAKRVERKLPVIARLTDSPGPGLAAQVVEVSPEEIPVSGPEMELDALRRVETEPIDVSGLDTGHHERRVALEPPPPHTHFGAVAVGVTIEVIPQEAERRFEGMELSTVGRSAAQVRPDRVDVTLWGPMAELEGVKRQHLVPVVHAEGLDPTQGAQEVSVRVRGVPDGLQVRSYPGNVLVTPRAGEE